MGNARQPGPGHQHLRARVLSHGDAGREVLVFSRRWGATWETTTAGDLYWVDARVLDQFRSQS